jgi:6-pyruvoyltetrahydropterin/6-carboxytetrahydropterin synthase
MYSIWKAFGFSAAHQLRGLPEGHQCARMHGHNYVVELELQREHLDEVGFVRDFGELKLFKTYLDGAFDHRTMNDVMEANPTAENFAYHLFKVASVDYPEVVAVRVWETPTSAAEYRELP